MGYTLIIGEAVLNYDNDPKWPSVSVEATTIKSEDAPAHGEPTDHSSERWPSYTSWANAMKWAGLSGLFDSKNELCLIPTHPGAIPLVQKHREIVNAAYEAKKAAGYIPSYDTNDEGNGWMVRLEWLHYWINYALDNCEKPIFCNH